MGREADFTELGNDLLLIGRVAYRFKWREAESMEAGFTIRTPLGAPFRETAGAWIPSSIKSDTRSDLGGELLLRQVSFYLRGSF